MNKIKFTCYRYTLYYHSKTPAMCCNIVLTIMRKSKAVNYLLKKDETHILLPSHSALSCPSKTEIQGQTHMSIG